MSTGTTAQGYDYLDPNADQPEVVQNGNFDRVDRLTGQVNTITFATDADLTIPATATGGAIPDWQYFVLNFQDPTGNLSTGRNVNLPILAKPYVVTNETLQPLTFQTSVTGKAKKLVAADKARHLFVVDSGDVFAAGPATNLTAVT